MSDSDSLRFPPPETEGALPDALPCTVVGITYRNDKNGYTVARVQREEGGEPVVAVGPMPGAEVGDALLLRGRWTKHPTYGVQLAVESCEVRAPTGRNGLVLFLGGGRFKGIGPKTAERIVDALGPDLLERLRRNPTLLATVPGLGRERARAVGQQLLEQEEAARALSFLQEHGLGPTLALRVFRAFGVDTVARVRGNPYELAEEVAGIGFRIADGVARSLGVEADGSFRVAAGLAHLLAQAALEGHVGLPPEELVRRAALFLEVHEQRVEQVLVACLVPPGGEASGGEPRTARARGGHHDPWEGELPPAHGGYDQGEPVPDPWDDLPDLAGEGAHGAGAGAAPPSEGPAPRPAADARRPHVRLVDDGLIYRPDLHAAEVRAADELLRLLACGRPVVAGDPALVVRFSEQRAGLELSDDQRAALALLLTHPVAVLTGGPGVGKTTLLRCLVDALRGAERTFALAAPTGRAARRLEQATGAAASTLHRLLGLLPAGLQFKRVREERLDVDVLVIDEASMLDVTLAAATLSALPDGAALLLVGDVHQLPSVGPGEVLRAAIDSGAVPVARLDTIHRQAATSGIVRVAHEIDAGHVPRFDEDAGGQAFWVERREPGAALAALVALVTERIPARFGLHPLRDVQVLTPMHKGPLGTVALNEALRQALNPPAEGKPELVRFGRLFRRGDKVMQVRNNYDLDVFNGDIGVLSQLDEDDDLLLVDFEGRRIEYGLDQADQLEPAYAITCHKSQGSEFPAVLLPLFSSQFMMLRRNLVYTAFTRAKRVLVGIGEWSALQRAVATPDTGTRHGRLRERLRGE